jgi:type II secretory pathway component PulM
MPIISEVGAKVEALLYLSLVWVTQWDPVSGKTNKQTNQLTKVRWWCTPLIPTLGRQRQTSL